MLIPIQIAVFTIFPFPDTVAGWFALLREYPVAGLVDLDLLLVVDNVLLVVIALAAYVALRRTSPSVVLLSTGLWLLAIAMFVASNPSVEMLALSARFTDATTAAERAALLAAGQVLLAGREGTAFQVSYVVGQVAGIVIGLVMLRTDRFGKAVPYALIIGNVVGFGYYLPTVGLALSAFAGVILWVWYLLIARRFFQLGRAPALSQLTGERADVAGG
ncbi:MAG TPA: hypothetical protein VK923_12775 [Euzebyales bacterium]|nr:hypothetical protein [Euzebyales bacterium]